MAGNDSMRDRGGELRAANLRTALVLLSVALTFFLGVIGAKLLGGFEVGMSIVSLAAALFIAVAVGLNLRRGGSGHSRERGRQR
jgi:hypothetical protein